MEDQNTANGITYTGAAAAGSSDNKAAKTDLRRSPSQKRESMKMETDAGGQLEDHEERLQTISRLLKLHDMQLDAMEKSSWK